CGAKLARDHSKHRALTRAIHAEQRCHTGFDLRRHIVEADDLSIPARRLIEFNHPTTSTARIRAQAMKRHRAQTAKLMKSIRGQNGAGTIGWLPIAPKGTLPFVPRTAFPIAMLMPSMLKKERCPVRL